MRQPPFTYPWRCERISVHFMMKKRIAGLVGAVLAIGLAALVSPIYGEEQIAAVSQAGTWKFHPGDTLSWAAPDLDDSDWYTLTVPGTWGKQGFKKVQVGWYRLAVAVDPRWLENAGRLGIRLGNVSSSYEVYAGGAKIGGVGGPFRLEYDRDRTLRAARSTSFPVPAR